MDKKNVIKIIVLLCMMLSLVMSTSRFKNEKEDYNIVTDEKFISQEKEKITRDDVMEHETTSADLFTYIEYGDGVSISGYTGEDVIVVIPNEINGKKVVAIESKAFSGDSIVQGIKLPEGELELKSFSFMENYELQIVIAENAEIDICAFYMCVSLYEADFGEGLKSIEEMAFYGCSSLSRIYIPHTTESIGKTAFKYNNIIMEGCKGSYAEAYAKGLQKYTEDLKLRNRDSHCGGVTFEVIKTECTEEEFTDIVILEVINPLEKFTRDDVMEHETTSADLLTYIEYGDGVSITGYIGEDVIVVIPNEIDGKKVVAIEGEAFSGKSIVQGIKLPEGKLELKMSSFNGNEDLQMVIAENAEAIIGDGSFFRCTSLYEVDFGEGLKSIGECAFSYCDSLSRIYIPDTIEWIHGMAFAKVDIVIEGSKGSYAEEYVKAQQEYARQCKLVNQKSAVEGITFEDVNP